MPRRKSYGPSRKTTGCLLALAQLFTRNASPNQVRALRTVLPTNAEKPEELHPHELEVLAAYVYQRLDYFEVKHTGAHSSTDGGVDVWMLTKTGKVEIVQCKQWQSKISKTDLIDFAKTMRQQHASAGHFWAPHGFSQPAIDYAAQNNIELYSDFKIRKLLEKVLEIEETRAQTQSKSKPVRKKKKGFAAAQVVILFGMVIVLSSILCVIMNAMILK